VQKHLAHTGENHPGKSSTGRRNAFRLEKQTPIDDADQHANNLKPGL
jgi:hypothetical protein